MSDEYRAVLKRWAAQNVPADLAVKEILAVTLLYTANTPDWSDVTPGDDSQFGFQVRYRDAAGEVKFYSSADSDQATRTMSQMLTELFRIAEKRTVRCERCSHIPAEHDAGGCRTCSCSLPRGGY